MTVSPKGNTLTSPDCKPTETRNKDRGQHLQLRKGSRTVLLKQHERKHFRCLINEGTTGPLDLMTDREDI